MTDDDHLLTATGDRRAHVLEARSRPEPLVGLRLGAECPRQLPTGLPCAQQRAREHGLGACVLSAQPRAERTGLLAALSGQRTQLVRLSGRGFCVTDEVEAHGA